MKKYLIAGLLTAGISGVAMAASDDVESTSAKQPILVMEQAVALAKHYGQGAVTKVEFERKGDRNLFEAKIARDNGDVRKLYIDAHTAEVLDNQGVRF